MPQRNHPPACFSGKLLASCMDQDTDFLQDHIPKQDAVLFVRLLETVKKQIGHDAVLPHPTAFPDAVHTGAESKKPRNAVRGIFSKLLGLSLLLLLNIPDASHDLPASAVRIIDRSSRQRHP